MVRALLCLLAGAVLVLGTTEIVLRVLPVPTATQLGYYVDPEILNYPPGHRWQVATGWDLRNSQTLRANNLGFAAGRDFVPDPDAVALIGDSYVEASMLSESDRPGAQLERELGRPVYAMGGPGSSLLDYAERIRFAHHRLGSRDFVVLMEAGDIRQSLCGSGNVHSPCLDRKSLAPRSDRRPEPSALARVARQSALAQYFVGQLRLNAPALLALAFRRSTPESAARPHAVPDPPAVDAPPFVDAVADAFFKRAAQHVGGRLVIVIDGARDPKRPLSPLLAAERARFMEKARAAGASIVDAEPLYAAHYERSLRSLNVGPYDGHLNPIGVSLVAAAAAKSLRR